MSISGYWILLAIFYLILDFFIAKEFADIAEMKGHSGTRYGAFTFFFGVIGMLMVIALPTLPPKSPSTPTPPPPPAPNPQRSLAKPRDEGLEDGDFADLVCPNCGKTVSVLVGAQTLTCPWCDTPLNINYQ